jgi:hypothetical protein
MRDVLGPVVKESVIENSDRFFSGKIRLSAAALASLELFVVDRGTVDLNRITSETPKPERHSFNIYRTFVTLLTNYSWALKTSCTVQHSRLEVTFPYPVANRLKNRSWVLAREPLE